MTRATRFRITLAAAAVGAAALARPGHTWEAATTHAGLTEQAALASSLHERLEKQFGLERGLFGQLTVPPADAPELFVVLRRLNPTHGYVPDRRGRMHAIGWLVAGSVIADTPEELAANHFFDPVSGAGLSPRTLRGLLRRIRHRVVTAFTRAELERSGVAAPDWISHQDNPFNLAGFRDQYAKAVSARTPGERARHLAGALLAAGAALHVLEDMGSPSHVRNDLAAHLESLGPDPTDVGSRFERIAALAYGRLGVPAPARPVERRPLRAFFTAPDRSGLADRTAASYFSAYTLPRPIDLGGDPRAAVRQQIAGAVQRPAPVPPAVLDLRAAVGPGGAELEREGGVCLARYRVEDRRLSWSIDDACALEQVGALLPEVASYAAGMLDTLFGGTLTLEPGSGGLAVRAGTLDLGPGELTVYWDDARGVRQELGKVKVSRAAAGDVAGQVKAPPAGATPVSALFVGADAAGEPLLATGTSLYPIAPGE